MADVSQVFASPWLKAEDLKGQTVQVIIHSADFRKMKSQQGTMEDKVILNFRGKDGTPRSKSLIMNKMQFLSLQSITGSTDTDMWLNREITLSPVPSTQPGKFTIMITGVAQQAGGGVLTF